MPSFHTLLIIAHIVGVAMGVGGATVNDFLFVKFIKDGVVDKKEMEVMKGTATIIWSGLILLIFSGLANLLYHILRSEYDELLDQRLWVKLAIVAVITANAVVIHRRIIPLLERHVDKPLLSDDFMRNSRLFLAVGTVSFVSWYSALFLGGWMSDVDGQFLFLPIFAVYAAALLSAVTLVVTVGERLLKKKSSS